MKINNILKFDSDLSVIDNNLSESTIKPLDLVYKTTHDQKFKNKLDNIIDLVSNADNVTEFIKYNNIKTCDNIINNINNIIKIDTDDDLTRLVLSMPKEIFKINKISIVYEIYNKNIKQKNGKYKCYIGQTNDKYPLDRIKEHITRSYDHKNYSKDSLQEEINNYLDSDDTPLHYRVKAILINKSKLLVNLIEIALIYLNDSKNQGYNLTRGGEYSGNSSSKLWAWDLLNDRLIELTDKKLAKFKWNKSTVTSKVNEDKTTRIILNKNNHKDIYFLIKDSELNKKEYLFNKFLLNYYKKLKIILKNGEFYGGYEYNNEILELLNIGKGSLNKLLRTNESITINNEEYKIIYCNEYFKNLIKNMNTITNNSNKITVEYFKLISLLQDTNNADKNKIKFIKESINFLKTNLLNNLDNTELIIYRELFNKLNQLLVE